VNKINDIKVLNNLDKLGQKYVENLANSDEDPTKNWWIGLEFFFDKVFNRGRSDKLSKKYMTFTKIILKNRYKVDLLSPKESYKLLLKDYKQEFLDKNFIIRFKKKNNINMNKNCLNFEKFKSEVKSKNPLIDDLTNIKKIDVDYRIFGGKEKNEFVTLGNDKDIIMVLDTLKFICSKEENNIYKHLKSHIKNEGIDETYKILTDKEIGIAQIGDKLATFVIRDIVLIDPSLIRNKNVDYEKMFPIDTWVRQIYYKMSGDKKNIKDKEIKKFYIEKCLKNDYFPPKIAAGLWYLSFISLDILIDNLDVISV